MTDRECLNVLSMALSQIKCTYLTHKLAVVVTKGKKKKKKKGLVR